MTCALLFVNFIRYVYARIQPELVPRTPPTKVPDLRSTFPLLATDAFYTCERPPLLANETQTPDPRPPDRVASPRDHRVADGVREGPSRRRWGQGGPSPRGHRRGAMGSGRDDGVREGPSRRRGASVGGPRSAADESLHSVLGRQSSVLGRLVRAGRSGPPTGRKVLPPAPANCTANRGGSQGRTRAGEFRFPDPKRKEISHFPLVNRGGARYNACTVRGWLGPPAGGSRLDHRGSLT